MSTQIIGLQGWGALWTRDGDWNNPSRQTIVTIPRPISAQMLAENCGTGCLRITCPSAAEFGMSTYGYSWTKDTWWGATMLATGRTYRMECGVHGEGLLPTDANIRYRATPYFDWRVAGIVNGAWVKLSAQFTVTNWLTSSMGVNGPSFLFTGPGTVYADNAVLYNVTDGGTACHFYKPVHGIWRHYVGASTTVNKGVLRYCWLDDPFEYMVQSGVMSARRWDVNLSTRACQPMHLPSMVQAACESGATPAARPIL
ncbi:MAG: hypothetical protein N2595_09515 [bacterium]|nr:hypothetical protein [bacterium]